MRGLLSIGRTGTRKGIAPVYRPVADNYAFDVADSDDDADVNLPTVIKVKTMHDPYNLSDITHTAVGVQAIADMAQGQSTHSGPSHPVQHPVHQQAQQAQQAAADTPEPASGSQVSTLQAGGTRCLAYH